MTNFYFHSNSKDDSNNTERIFINLWIDVTLYTVYGRQTGSLGATKESGRETGSSDWILLVQFPVNRSPKTNPNRLPLGTVLTLPFSSHVPEWTVRRIGPMYSERWFPVRPSSEERDRRREEDPRPLTGKERREDQILIIVEVT